MAFGISIATPSSFSTSRHLRYINPSTIGHGLLLTKRRNRKSIPVCFVLLEDADSQTSSSGSDESMRLSEMQVEEEKVERHRISALRLAEKRARKKSERFTYLVAAVMSSFGITSMAVMSVYYRFYWQMEGTEIPLTEMFGTFALSLGAAVGMEFWARWAHKALWHDSLWHMLTKRSGTILSRLK